MSTPRTKAPSNYDRGSGSSRGDSVWFNVLRNLGYDDEDDHYEGAVLGRVYFVLDKAAGQVKIGYTGNVQSRLRKMTHKRGRELELLGTLAGGYDLERAMHGRFHAHRVEGREWYSAEILPEVLTLLAT